MNNIRTAFADFWGGFLNRSSTPYSPITAFPSGYAVEYNPGAPTMGRPPPLPYITYDLARSSYGDFALLSGRIWTRSSDWTLVDDVLAQAAERIPEGGVTIETDGGLLAIYRSNPFTDFLPPENRDILNKAAVIRIIVKNFVL